LLQSLNLPNVDPGVSIGAHVEWDFKMGPAPINVLGRVRQNADSDRGAQADLRLNVGLHASGGLIVAAYAQATWASSKSIESYYAVNNADSSLLYTSLGLLGSYDLSRHWSAVAGVQGRRLHGDAAGSMIVESKSNFYANAGIAYRF
jgi:outer membrane scaffolding protein for murein synthesis (MipA/OmpV family)